MAYYQIFKSRCLSDNQLSVLDAQATDEVGQTKFFAIFRLLQFLLQRRIDQRYRHIQAAYSESRRVEGDISAACAEMSGDAQVDVASVDGSDEVSGDLVAFEAHLHALEVGGNLFGRLVRRGLSRR